MHLLRPSAADLRTVAPPLGHAFSEGAVNLKAATSLNNELAESSEALKAFAENPVTELGLEDFTQTLEVGNPLLAGIAPEQSVCNYLTLAFRNVANLESENIGVGTLARVGLVLAPNGPNNEGYPASAPANGPSPEFEATTHKLLPDTGKNHLHANPYPNVAGPGQPQLCEAGNESYAAGKTLIGHAPSASSNREITSREENLFGEKYSPATLEALGLVKAKAKAPSKAHAKKPAKGKKK
jgi:hypothetical protein